MSGTWDLGLGTCELGLGTTCEPALRVDEKNAYLATSVVQT
jgi:hypothetical protein